MQSSLAAGLRSDRATFGLAQLQGHLQVLLEEGRILAFEFRRYPGGPCDKSIPATVFLKKVGQRKLRATTIRAGFPCKNKDISDFLEASESWMRSHDFERVSYLDMTGYKVQLAVRKQVLFPPVRVEEQQSEVRPAPTKKWGWVMVIVGVALLVGAIVVTTRTKSN